MDTFTVAHVILSLIGILSGLVVLYGLLTANRMNYWTTLFLVTTVATSVTGFGFPFHGVTPAIIVGILSVIVLTAAIAGPRRGAGAVHPGEPLVSETISSRYQLGGVSRHESIASGKDANIPAPPIAIPLY